MLCYQSVRDDGAMGAEEHGLDERSSFPTDADGFLKKCALLRREKGNILIEKVFAVSKA